MKKIISLLAIFFTGFQASYVQAGTISETTVASNISIYNQMAEQYNTAGKDRGAFKRRVLLNLRTYVNKVLSFEQRAELKKRGLILRITPKNGIIPLLSTNSIVRQSTSISTSTQGAKNAKLSIKESSYQKVSEEFNFKVYEADVTANDGDVVLEKIDLVQFGSGGEGINIGELYKRDYGGNMLKLTNSRDARESKFYKRDGNPGISFDLFTGYEPGMKIRNGETVKFTIKIDSSSFADGKDFQRTNIFFAKYKIKENPEPILGITPQIIVYSVCDEGVVVKDSSTPIVFDTNLSRNLFKKTKITLYTKNIQSDRRIPTESEYKVWKNTLVDQDYASDYEAYQSDISEGFANGSTYDQWLKQKYLDRLVSAYESDSISWAFYGYKSTITSQFAPPKGVSCSQLENIAKAQKIAFKTTYDDIVRSSNQDRVNQLTDRVTELEALNAGCTIKGNVNFDTGEKIYHIPGARFYDETDINALYGERWFCSETDAVNAGWREERGY